MVIRNPLLCFKAAALYTNWSSNFDLTKYINDRHPELLLLLRGTCGCSAHLKIRMLVASWSASLDLLTRLFLVQPRMPLAFCQGLALGSSWAWCPAGPQSSFPAPGPPAGIGACIKKVIFFLLHTPCGRMKLKIFFSRLGSTVVVIKWILINFPV